jgi:NAD(P)-dependent dehydrogenase (short-subunit alcohol dehydrogenase family)
MKTVLVTGGEVRLGLAISKCLRSKGWRVITSSHREGTGADIVADLSRSDGAVKLYLEAIRMAPELSAIVNNAALFTGGEEEMVAVNCVAPEKLTMLLAGKEGERCTLVNILDAEILQSPRPECASAQKLAYLETKKRLFEFTKKSAALFAETLRVNAVAPGSVLAPEGLHEKSAERLLPARPSPEDVAEAVAYLLSADSVTGTVLPVDGGQHLL